MSDESAIAVSSTVVSQSAAGRRGRLLPWFAWGFGLLVVLGDIFFLVVNGPTSVDSPSTPIAVVQSITFLLISTLGFLILRSDSSNVIGWWIMVAGVGFPLESVAAGYAFYAIGHDLSGALIDFASWLPRWIWIGPAINVPFMFIYYPDGRLPSPKWRWVTRAAFSLLAVIVFLSAFSPTTDAELGANPYGIPRLDPFLPALDFLYIFFPALVVVAVIALIHRYRIGGQVVRRQLKFIAWLAGVSILFFSGAAGALPPDVQALLTSIYGLLVVAVIVTAVTRHRLFDIDRLISRTLSYAVVVVVLVGVYAGLVALLQVFVPSDNPVVVAASTLAVAALFNPVRKRVQAWVDRRFNRSRYDAERVVEGFVGSLRDRVEVGDVVDGWVGVVSETMQPSTIRVWIRG